tara:strand:- start:96 stop:308 length:213 start_codon:yes stop_codon:yes gene_type:complete
MDKTEKARALRKFYYHGREVNNGTEFLMNKADYDSHIRYGFIEPVILKVETLEAIDTKEEKATRKTKTQK